jgi:hypothetical protein
MEYILNVIKTILSNYYLLVSGNTNKNININNTTKTDGDWMAVQMISNTVIASITIDGAVDTGWSALTQAEGKIIYGKITSITLTSGNVRMYGNITQKV